MPLPPADLGRRGFLAGTAGLALPAQPPASSLKAAAARRGLIYGAAFEPEPLEHDPGFRDLAQQQCGLLASENVLKWNALRPTQDRFDFDRADRLFDVARQFGVPVHGHCLAWHEAMPAWLAPALNPRTGATLLRDHIHTVVSRYAGRVRSWDVVNEGIERNDRRPDGLRRSPWLEALGPGYINLAFEAAHAADPKARLGFADYGLEYDNVSWMVEKRGTLLAFLKALKQQQVPLHALALQGHLDATRPAGFGAGLKTFLARVADLGLEIYVTELDVDDQKLAGSAAQRDAVVADLYGRFLDVMLAEPAVKMINTWGLSDRYSSKSELSPRADGQAVRPLPFDRDLRAKPVALTMLDRFDRAPRG
jgi:endo-1,4-beta-xylanase